MSSQTADSNDVQQAIPSEDIASEALGAAEEILEQDAEGPIERATRDQDACEAFVSGLADAITDGHPREQCTEAVEELAEETTLTDEEIDGLLDDAIDDASSVTSWETARWQYAPQRDGGGDDDRGRYTAANVIEDELTVITNDESMEISAYDADRGIFAAGGENRIREHVSRGLEHRSKQSRSENIIYELMNRTFTPVDEHGGPDGKICVNNGVLDIDERTLEDHSPAFKFIRDVNTGYDADATADEWAAFIEEVVAPEDVDKLQEYCGYCLMHWADPYKKMLIMQGPTDSGKSTLLNVITEMLGVDNVSNETLHEIADTRWGAAQTFGKYANICSELSPEDIDRVEALKRTAGKDKQRTGEFKYGNKFTFEPTEKHLYAVNRLPSAPNGEDAFYNRWLHVSMPNQIPPEEQDEAIEDDLLADAPGILNWMLEGYERLREQGGFSNVASIDEKRNIWNAHGTEVAQFTFECLDVSGDPGDVEPVEDVHAAFVRFCEADDRLTAQTKTTLTQELQKNSPVAKKRRRIDGDRVYCYVGVTLIADAE